MILRLSILFVFFSISLQSQEWKQESDKTKVNFKIKNFGLNVDGSFQELQIFTNLDIENIASSFLSADIQVKSLETGIKGRDEHLFKEDYFHEEKFNLIELKSTKIQPSANGEFLLFGDLTIKGVTKKVEFPLKVNQTETNLSISSRFTLNRKEFGIGGGSLVLSKKVEVFVEYFGTKTQ